LGTAPIGQRCGTQFSSPALLRWAIFEREVPISEVCPGGADKSRMTGFPKLSDSPKNQSERQPGHGELAHGAGNEWTQPLFAHLAKICPQFHSGKGQEKCPTREVPPGF
jgi:hypothetical protein